MKRNRWQIEFILTMIILLLASNIIVKNNSTNNKQVMLVGTVIGLVTKPTVLGSDEIENGKIKTSNENIGIMTCIDLETNRYIALCHSISVSNKAVEISNGECYNVDLISIEKSNDYSVGSINAILNTNMQYGNVTENTNYGVYGNITNYSEFKNSKNQIYSIAPRTQIKKGDAEIYIDFDGSGLKSYEIEIIGINYLKNQNLHIKVKDKQLIDITGGIIKGMSGTPIIQNGKLIGAINCVSAENPIDAYGMFADKLFK